MSNFSMFKNENELEEMEKTIETNSKKNLVIVPHGRYGLFLIKWDDGRSTLPDILDGQYTSQSNAEKAIKTYVANHRTTKQKEKKEREFQRDEKIRLGDAYVEPSETDTKKEEV